MTPGRSLASLEPLERRPALLVPHVINSRSLASLEPCGAARAHRMLAAALRSEHPIPLAAALRSSRPSAASLVSEA